MPSKRPLTSHGTCGIVNRPSNHNSVLSKGCQCIYVSQSILAGFGVKVKLIDSEFPLFKDFVATMTSVRNHGISPPLEEIVVYAQGCSTYDLPLAVAKEIGAVSHPQDLAHHMGLYLTAARGAKIVDSVQFAAEIHPNGVKKV
ncbi:nicotinamidase 1 [Selaginella moellendorffii]|uniref:nicotinamidase 1 n=1 Tax=Selaginella moellendorffii TaxID=88036 RepID=UPI000D1C7D54|nr:nicotinamidase 1 [Selaginella moellendorffii]|eukprot:XP_024533812.1 nicotinamidase 1 [Selaginella moellendorffii]